MPPVTLPLDTQLTNLQAPPAMVRFWSDHVPTMQFVSTSPRLTRAPEPELHLEHLRVVPPARGAVRAAVRQGPPLHFLAAPGSFVLDDDEE